MRERKRVRVRVRERERVRMRERIKYGKRMRTLFEENGRTVWHLIVVTRHIIICKEMNDFFTYSYDK